MANTGSKNRRKRDGKRGAGRKPAPTKDLGSTTAVAVADLTPEAGSPLALASEAHFREAASAVVEAAMQGASDPLQAAPKAVQVAAQTAPAEVRDRAGPQVRVKVSSGESRGMASYKKAMEPTVSEVKVSRWLRDAGEPKATVSPSAPAPVAALPPAAVVSRPVERAASKRVKTPTDVERRRSATWLWVFAASVALVTWIMLDRPSSEHNVGAVAPPKAPITRLSPKLPEASASTKTAEARPATTAPAVTTQVTLPKSEVAKVTPPLHIAKAERPPIELAKAERPPMELAKVGPPPTELAKVGPSTTEVAKVEPVAVLEAPPQPAPAEPVVPTPTPEILALAERISANDSPRLGKRPAHKVLTAPRRPTKANPYDEVPPKAAAYQPRNYDEVLPLSGMRVADEETLTRGRQYDHVPPRAASPIE